MPFLTRRSRQYLQIEKHLRIAGDTSEAFIVTPARSLVIDGAYNGGAWVEILGTLQVNGRFSASVESNAGLVLISGVLETDTRNLPGVIRVRAGSTIVRGGVDWVLGHDGRLGQPEDLHPVTTSTEGPFFHLNEDRWTFSPSRR